jgi:hypothetical protein
VRRWVIQTFSLTLLYWGFESCISERKFSTFTWELPALNRFCWKINIRFAWIRPHYACMCVCVYIYIHMYVFVILVLKYIYIYIHIHICRSFSSLSHDRVKDSSKSSSPPLWLKASSFKWGYPLLSLRSSSSFLRLFHRLPFISIPPFIFPSVTSCRRQFLRKMWPIQSSFRLLISCRIFLCSLTLSNNS